MSSCITLVNTKNILFEVHLNVKTKNNAQLVQIKVKSISEDCFGVMTSSVPNKHTDFKGAY